MKFYCVNCGREKERYDHKNSGRRTRSIRPSDSITCSGKCSKEWTRKNDSNRQFFSKQNGGKKWKIKKWLIGRNI